MNNKGLSFLQTVEGEWGDCERTTRRTKRWLESNGGPRSNYVNYRLSLHTDIVILAPLQFGGFMYYEIVHKASKVILFIFSQLTH